MPFVNDGFAKQDPASGGGGGSTNASDLTSGTLADARLSSGILNATYQHNQYVTTTGTSTAYVATPTVAFSLTDGNSMYLRLHTTIGASATLNISGTGAKPLLTTDPATGLGVVSAGHFVVDSVLHVIYGANDDSYIVLNIGTILAGDLPSHSHTASDTTSGSFNTARIADGTATAGYVPISDGDGTSTWGAPSATDSTKLALDGSNAMTNRLQFSGAGTSAGASVANIFRDSDGDLNYNVTSGRYHDFTVNGTRALAIGSTGLITTITTVTTTATISTPYTRCNHASTPFTVTLPAATGSGTIFMIKNIGAAVVTVDGNASETIDGATTITLAQYSAVTLVDAASGAWDII